MNSTKERPILFSAPMVRAILEGRKTQTRRVVDLDNLHGFLPRTVRGDSIFSNVVAKPGKRKLHTNQNFAVSAVLKDKLLGLKPGEFNFLTPYAGECRAETDNRRWTLEPLEESRLWVRETWHTDEPDLKRARAMHEDFLSISPIYYGADPANRDGGCRWRPSIHMCQWMSRITLEIAQLRIERLQDITEEDARREGLRSVTKDGQLYKWGIPDLDGLPGSDDVGWPWSQWEVDPRAAFRRLWDSIHGSDPLKSTSSWDANPWVWVVEFRGIKP